MHCPIYLSTYLYISLRISLSVHQLSQPIRPSDHVFVYQTCLGFLPACLPELFFVLSVVKLCVYLYICLFVSSIVSVLKVPGIAHSVF